MFLEVFPILRRAALLGRQNEQLDLRKKGTDPLQTRFKITASYIVGWHDSRILLYVYYRVP